MPIRLLLGFTFALVSGLLMTARAEDSKEREKINAANEAFNSEVKKIRTEVIEWFDKREEKAARVGNKKLLEELRSQREEFAAKDLYPEWPSDMPMELRTRVNKSQSQFETVYESAIKDCIKAKKDEEAGQIERELAFFRSSVSWQIFDVVELGRTEIKDGSIQIPTDMELHTRKQYRGGFEIKMVAKTEKDNIRLHAHNGATVIWNWEVKPSELRICRPDGKADVAESGSIAKANVTPLKPNTYYTLKWLMTPKGMTVSVNGKVVFTEKKEYNLDSDSKISIMTAKSKVEVKEFTITKIIEK